MNLISNFSFDFGDKNNIYYKLLSEEDFDFKSKDINIKVIKKDLLEVKVVCHSVLDLKIASNALIKSLEVIDKTLNLQNESGN